MIERIAIKNFKAIGPDGVDIKLAPLTLFVGENGTGKSSALEGLAVLAQSTRPTMKYGLRLDGSLVTLTDDHAPIHHAGRTEVPIELSVDWVDARGQPCRAGWSVRQEGLTGRGEWKQFIEDSTWERIEFEAAIRLSGSTPTIATMRGKAPASFPVPGHANRFLDEHLFLAADPVRTSGLVAWQLRAEGLAGMFTGDRVRYIAALRGGRLMDRKAAGAPIRVGAHGEDTIRLLNLLQGKGTRAETDLLAELAKRFGMPRLTAHWAGGDVLEVTFDDPHAGTRLDVFSAGYGSQQALPVLADMVHAKQGSMLLAEEIEHSCHPKWVAAWGETLAEVVTKRKIQIVATTHAPDLVLAVTLAIRKGTIPAKDVAIYQFDRDEKGARATPVSIGDDGVLEAGWIETFAKAERALLDPLLFGDDEETPSRASGGGT